MSKGLRSITDKTEREWIVDRRLANKTDGLGYLAAKDYRAKFPKDKK